MEDVVKNQAMLRAVKSGDLDVVEEILENDKDYLNKVTPFGSWSHISARSGQIGIAECLLNKGIDINARGGTSNAYPLNDAANGGHEKMVSMLLSHGAKFDTDEPERNALFSAVYNGNTEVARMLVDAGFNYTVRYTGSYMKNMGVLEFAKEQGHQDTIKYIESLFKRS